MKQSAGRKREGSTCLLVLLLLFCFFALLLGGGAWYFHSSRRTAPPSSPFPSVPMPIALDAAMKNYGVVSGDPLFIRIIKEPKILELWMRPRTGNRYFLIKQYPIISMSGHLGPKQKEGDWQAPEGFYQTHAGVLNPHSRYHLSFNICYPNAYDQALGRTGSLIMIHGGDKSMGCFAMGDPAIEEIYGLVEACVKNTEGEGETAFVPVQVYPFVPTPERLNREIDSPYYEFWSFLARAWRWTEEHQAPAVISFKGREMNLEE